MSSAEVGLSTSDTKSESTRLVSWVLITLVYALTHGLSLFNRGLYWDDWVFWRQAPAVVAEAGRAMGSTWPSWINNLFYYSQAGITLDRLVAFLSLLFVAFVLYDVLRRMPGVGESTAMWAAVVFSVFPVYQARIAMVMVGYGLCLALFAAAVWLMVRFGPRTKLWLQLVIIALFVTAFHTASLLVLFYAVVPVIILVLDPPDRWRPIEIAKKLRYEALLLVTPVAFWIATRIWFRPSGLYKEYNEIGATSHGLLGDLMHGIVNSVIFSVTDAIPGAVTKGVVHPGLKTFLLMLLLVGVICLVASFIAPLERRRSDTFLKHMGGVLIVAAVFPYAAVGKVPANFGWETRHQLLVPIGAALFVVAAAQSHASRSRWGRIAVSVALAAFIGLSAAEHVNSYINYQRDWLKQEAYLEKFRTTPQVKSGRFIIIDDKASGWSETKWDPYVYTGMLAEVFGDQKRLGYPFMAGARWFDYAYVRRWYIHQPYYKTGEYTGVGGPDYVVTIRKGKLSLDSGSTVIRLMLLDCFDREALRKEIGQALTITVKPYRAAPKEAKQ